MNALPGMELSYQQQLETAMAQPLELKIMRAIAFLQFHEKIALQSHEEGYWLAFSGGKDSVVIKELARLAGVRFKPVYNQTTIDPPELVRFIQHQHSDVEWSRPEKNMIMYMVENNTMPPTMTARWCCRVYKEHGGTGWGKIIGVRAAESPRRAAMWREVKANESGGTIFCPILYWTDRDIWTFIKSRSIPYCSLYDEGFKRLGCIGCPMSGPSGTKRDFARWPGFERLWKIGFKMYWNKWHGVPRQDGKPRGFERFSNWEEHWEWWVSRVGWEQPGTCQGMLPFLQSSEGNE